MKKNKAKRIGIDARLYGPIGKGLGRYTQELVDNIIKIDQENEYVIFLGKDNFDEFPCSDKRVKKVLAKVKWYTLAEQIIMPYLIMRARVDLMHFPHFNAPMFCPKKFVVTIHDLILTKFPTKRATTLAPLFYKIKNIFYKINIWTAIKRAQKVIAVSRYTKQEIIKYFKAKPSKIVVTYEGVANLAKGRDSLFAAKLDDKDTLLGYNIDNPFLLYVGNAYPHKNLEGLIKVFSKLRLSINNDLLIDKKFRKIKENQTTPNPSLSKEGGDSQNLSNIKLVLVGKEDYFYKRVKQYAKDLGCNNNKNNFVLFPGYVPDIRLEVLYKKALVYVFPSFYEGFGLPPLEAMAKGCPVVSSNKTCMPEILGKAAIYFNPDNEDEMLKKIKKVIGDKDLRSDLVKKGRSQIKKFSFWEMARETWGVYNSVLNKK